MTDEKKFIIPLDSPLDINSNDMFVDANRPKFSFNRQRYLGSVLQNSVRYEADGWFAGWWVHNFVTASSGTITITPQNLGQPSPIDKLIPGVSDRKYWSVSFYDASLEFYFLTDVWQVWDYGAAAAPGVARVSDGVVRITGTTTAGKTFTVESDAYTGNVLSFTSSDSTLRGSGYFDNGTFKLEVDQLRGANDDMLYVRYGQNLELYGNLETPHEYSYANGVNKWGDLISVTNNVFTLDDTDHYEFVSAILEHEDLENEYWDVTLKSIGFFTVDCEVLLTYVGGYDLFTNFNRRLTTDTDLVDKNNPDFLSANDAVNREALGYTAINPSNPTWNSWINCYWKFPVWIMFAQDYDIRFEMEVTGRYTYNYPTVPQAYYTCLLYMYINRKNKRSGYQNAGKNLDTNWVITAGIATLTDAGISEDPANPTRVRISNSARNIDMSPVIPITFYIRNSETNAEFPYPANTDYASVRYNYTINLPSFEDCPPPPPTWQQAINNTTWNNTFNTAARPTDWANPVSYVSTYASWPPEPAGWDSSYAWPPAWPWGISGLPAGEWHTASITFANYLQSYRPVNWPVLWSGVPWPVVPEGGWTARTWVAGTGWVINTTPPNAWTPRWPINWPFPLSDDPPGWYSNSITYDGYVASHAPFIWPHTNTSVGFAWPSWAPAVLPAPWPVDPTTGPGVPYPFTIPAGYTLVTSTNPDGTYNFNTATPTGWPPYNILVPLFSYAVCTSLTVHNNIGNPYDFTVLNRPSLLYDDKHLFWSNSETVFQRTTNVGITLPLCIYGYTIFQIFTVDITLCVDGTATVDAFLLREISNNEANRRVFRVDTNMLWPGSANFTLSAFTPSPVLSSIIPANGGVPVLVHFGTFEYLLAVNYLRLDEDILFDKVIIPSYGINSTSNLQSSIPRQMILDNGFYPAWIVDSYGGNEWWKQYNDVSVNNGVNHVAHVTITWLAWVKGQYQTPKATVTPESVVNDKLLLDLMRAKLVMINATGREHPWAPGVFTQEFDYVLDLDRDIGVHVHFNVVSQTSTETWYPASIAPWYDEEVHWNIQNTPRTEYHIVATMKRSQLLNFNLYRAFIIAKTGMMAGASIATATQQWITFDPSTYGKVNKDGTYSDFTGFALRNTEVTSTTVTIFVEIPNKAVVRYIPEGIYWFNKTLTYTGRTKTIDGVHVYFNYEGVNYDLFIGDGAETRLVFNVTDIRDNTTRELARESVGYYKMPIKQFWSNDVTIENYWWINSNHVLALSRYEITLWRKVVGPSGQPVLDDWMGDRWEVVKTAPRAKFFEQSDLYYSVTSAKDTTPGLIKMRDKSPGGLEIYWLNDILGADFFNMTPAGNQWQTRIIPCIEIEPTPGKPVALSKDSISSFLEVNVNTILCSGRISHTVVSKRLIIGIALTRGIMQWTIVLDRSDINAMINVINGYGHVGLDGSLTGGQYPTRFCDNVNGFIGTVHNVADFKDFDQVKNNVVGPDEKIFCSGTSLWFVHRDNKGIVSHYTFNPNTNAFTMETLPLNNNYNRVQEASGHTALAMFDIELKWLTIIDIFLLLSNDSSAGMAVLSGLAAFLLPAVWYFQPQIGAAAYAAQGLHQAAYVIRNSLPPAMEDGKSDKDIIAVRSSVELTMSLNLGRVMTIVSIILSLTGSMMSAFNADDLMSGKSKGDQTPDDTKGRKLGQFASQAILDGVSTALATKGLVIAVKTKATESMSLNMFYSINDGNQCWAGPGFVNHQFIGQALAQGISIARLKVEKFGMYMPLRMMTDILMKLQLYANQVAGEVLDTISQAMGGSQGGMAGGTGFLAAGPLGWVLQAMVFMVEEQRVLLEYLAELVPSLYDALGNTARGFYTGGADRNVVEPEATHTYGNKPLSLFWPAFGVGTESITTERVDSAVRWNGVYINLAGRGLFTIFSHNTASANTTNINSSFFSGDPPFEGPLHFPKDVTVCSSEPEQKLPTRMACVEGIVNMLPTDSDLKNLQVNCCDYTFPPPPIHDYIISSAFGIGVQAANGEIISYSCDDTKLMDGPASNMIQDGAFFGIASSYTAIEIKDGYDHRYLRPWAVTPTCIALNLTQVNCVHMAKTYHGFDGQLNRIVSWKGGNGLDSATMVQQYCIVVNDHFKRSNIAPPSEFFGLFNGPPQIEVTAKGQDKVFNQVMDMTRQKGLDINIPGEDRDLTRYALCIHGDVLSTLPATVRMLAPYRLHVVEGITSLTTDVRSTQTKYKAPSSVDFNLYDTMYRATEEYIAQLKLQDGVVAVEDKYPSAGLTFIGATTREGFFYSPATRMYYSFSGDMLSKQDIFNRFKDIKNGRWDFVNQEVVFKMLLNDKILDNDVDGNFVARLDKSQVLGEIYPPNATIYNQRSDFKILSMAGGMVYQGPKRCIVNRWIITDDMYDQIRSNKRKWKKLERESWESGRDYLWHYDDLNTLPPQNAVYGWTHNPGRTATAMLGVSEETDCLFEWELTFAWTEQVARVFEQNEFITFNLAGETYGQGGIIASRPTHLFLYKELFQNGYYTTRYSSKNGIGNRERLYMWCDGVAALSSLVLYAKDITSRRTQPLATSQVDVQELTEQ
jgi:hypothetical protein